MALTADNVTVAATGAVYVAPAGTAAPTSYSSTLNAAFKDVGYLSENGVTITPNETVTKLQAWQNGETVKTIRRGQDITVSFEMIEARGDDAQKVYWGSGATVTSGTVEVSSLAGVEAVSIVVDAVDGDISVRYYFPKAVLSDRGAITLIGTNYVMYPVTFECQSDGTRFVKVWHEADGS
jgi:hypothetical protein